MISKRTLYTIAATTLIVCFTLTLPPIGNISTYGIQFEKRSYTVNIDGYINNKNSDKLVYLNQIIQKGDVVTLIIHSDGGERYHGVKMANLILEMRVKGAHVIAKVPVKASSAAADLLCYASETRISDTAYVLWHNTRYTTLLGNYKVITLENATWWWEKQVAKDDYKIITEHCKHLIPTEYVPDIVSGKDVFIQGKYINEKLKGE